jgi:hypothetical protein
MACRAPDERGDWSGYWSKQGPELLAHHFGLYDTEHRMAFGAKTIRVNIEMLGPDTEGAAMAPVDLILDDVEALLSELQKAVQHPLQDHGVVALPVLELADDA